MFTNATSNLNHCSAAAISNQTDQQGTLLSVQVLPLSLQFHCVEGVIGEQIQPQCAHPPPTLTFLGGTIRTMFLEAHGILLYCTSREWVKGPLC